MSKHQGEILRQRVKESPFNVKKLAHIMGIDRGTLYNAFDRAEVNPRILLQVGKLINHDFSMDFKTIPSSLIQEPITGFGKASEEKMHWLERELETCKVRCFDLMEENRLLLSGKLEEYFKKYGPITES